MTPFVWALLWNIVIWSVLIILIFILRFFRKQLTKYIDYFTAITVWIFLWIIFLWFLPEIIESWMDWHEIWIYILIWLFVFYILELVLHYHHCKDLSIKDENHHEHKNQTLIFIGTFLHNILHGIVLFSAFAINTQFGIATTIAVLLHGIPQNTANYIMNHNKELFVIIASLGGIIWTLTLFPFTDFLLSHRFMIISMIAWSLLYLALSDILPEVRNKWWIKTKLIYLWFMFIGVSFVLLLNHSH